MTMRYLTVVLELPEDRTSLKKVMDSFPLMGNFQGSRVTALYAGDAVTENEIYESNADPDLIKHVREQVVHR